MCSIAFTYDEDELPLPADKELFTPEEAYDIIMDDIRKIYEQKQIITRTNNNIL